MTVNGRALGVTRVTRARTAAATEASARARRGASAKKAAYTAGRLIEDLDETTLLGLKLLVDAEIERRLPDRDEEAAPWCES